MGLKFKSPLELSGHRAIAHTDVAQTLVVKVVTKTTAHPEYGNGSTSGYTIDGVEGAYLEFTPGNTYKFDQADSSNANHPLRFYEDAAKATAYTTGVTTNGTPGSSGAYTQIIPTTNTPPVLFYQCSAHSLMGSYVKFGTGTIGDTYSINATQDGSNVDLNLDAASGTDSTVQLTAGSNITLTRNDAQQITVASTASGDTYDLNAVQDGSNVDINLTSGSGSDNSAVQLTAGSNVTLTRNGAQEVTIAASGGSQGITIQEEGSALSTLATTLNFTGDNITASGTGATKTINVTSGGSGTVTIEKNVYTGDGSDVTFDTSTAIVNENNVQVYIDGVYQSKDNYTTSGSTVTMSTAPGNSTSVELIHMVSTSGVIARDSFTGNGSTTAYVLTMSISNENATQVYLDGVYQSKSNYSTSGSTLTFSTAPSNGTAIEVVHIKAVNTSSLNQNNFTGNGSTTAFTLSQTIDDEVKTFVFIQGVYQEKSTYSISGTTLTFTTAPQNGYTIEVMAFSAITVGNQGVTSVNGLTGAVTLETGTDWQSTVQTSNFTAAAGKGYFVDTSSNTVTVSLPAGGVGDEIHFVDYASTFDTNKIIFDANSSEKIQGSTDDYRCIIENATVRLIYQNATKGWTADNIVTDTLPPLVVSYLVIAGGGGGGGSHRSYTAGGGAGAGGLRNSFAGDNTGGGGSAETTLTLSAATNYTVTVGAGGAAGTETALGVNGSNSVFSTITSTGGGGGGSAYANTPNLSTTGGSGGGSTSYNNTAGARLSNPVQGYAGGTAYGNSAGDGCGGGGGAGAVGGNGGDTAGGNGGNGLSNSITGSAVTYAGGGGGGQWLWQYSGTVTPGTGGTGGGGAGNGDANGGDGNDGTANTGGGGGGGSAKHTAGPATINGGAGGSGTVILRYPADYTISGLSGSTATDGTSKVTTFTTGTGNIQFN